MGRRSWNDNPDSAPYTGKLYLRRIPLDSGGYDSGGAYWGAGDHGEQLYGYAAPDNSIRGYLRAYNRTEAAKQLLALHPGARLFSPAPAPPTAAAWFDSHGGYIGPPFPAECISDCTAPGRDVSAVVALWRRSLQFSVPRERAILYLCEYGAWSDQELSVMSDEELADIALWVACGDVREQGEWAGLVH